jgi:hypothetical protein
VLVDVAVAAVRVQEYLDFEVLLLMALAVAEKLLRLVEALLCYLLLLEGLPTAEVLCRQPGLF